MSLSVFRYLRDYLGRHFRRLKLFRHHSVGRSVQESRNTSCPSWFLSAVSLLFDCPYCPMWQLVAGMVCAPEAVWKCRSLVALYLFSRSQQCRPGCRRWLGRFKYQLPRADFGSLGCGSWSLGCWIESLTLWSHPSGSACISFSVDKLESQHDQYLLLISELPRQSDDKCNYNACASEAFRSPRSNQGVWTLPHKEQAVSGGGTDSVAS